MSNKDFFQYDESKKLVKLIDQSTGSGRWDRGSVFRDFVQTCLCALSGGRMEDVYLSTIKRYTDGKLGQRGIDRFCEGFALVVMAVEKKLDILGDVFQGGVTYGEHGQFFTPEPICRMMSSMCGVADLEPGKIVSDPCCGSGRMLLAAAEINPRLIFYGTDIDIRCAQMTAINLALWRLCGWVTCGDSLSLENRTYYRVGYDGIGVILECKPEDMPKKVEAEPVIEPPNIFRKIA